MPVRDGWVVAIKKHHFQNVLSGFLISPHQHSLFEVFHHGSWKAARFRHSEFRAQRALNRVRYVVSKSHFASKGMENNVDFLEKTVFDNMS